MFPDRESRRTTRFRARLSKPFVENRFSERSPANKATIDQILFRMLCNQMQQGLQSDRQDPLRSSDQDHKNPKVARFGRCSHIFRYVIKHEFMFTSSRSFCLLNVTNVLRTQVRLAISGLDLVPNQVISLAPPFATKAQFVPLKENAGFVATNFGR